MLKYKIKTVIDYNVAVNTKYLKICIEEVRVFLPSLSRISTHDISCILLVKGAATEASVSLREIPTSAYLRAPQSLAPSPHIPTTNFLFLNRVIKLAF